MLQKRKWKSCMMTYLLRLSGMYSGRKKERGRTTKPIGRGSYVISLSRCVDGTNNDLHCSWRGIDEVCNGELVHANSFGYNTHQLQLTPEVKSEERRVLG
jgi:hypothetical protein